MLNGKGEPMSDLIRRDDVVNLLTEHFTRAVDDFSIPIAFFPTPIDYFRRLINRIPTAEPKVGKWIENETSYADNVRQTCDCSVCGKRSPRPLGDYCRWCGAKMEGSE